MKHLSIAQPLVGEEEVQAVSAVLRSGMLAAGPVVKKFEEAFAISCGAKHAIATNNGTSALHAAFLAAGIGPGDEVIVPTFSFFATASAVSMCGAMPVFADVDGQTYNLDPESAADCITPQTRAICGVHLFGQPCDVASLRDLCDDRGLLLIEDAAQAHGATYFGDTVGSLGDLACFSFYATKNMLTGEGGMVTTASKKFDDCVRSLINHGQQEKYLHVRLGYNYRMTDLAAAIGLAQLAKLGAMNAARRKNASILDRSLKGTALILPVVRPGVNHVYHQYVVRVAAPERDEFMRSLQDRGISTAVHYPRCIHEQPYYRSQGVAATCPVGEQISHEVVSLPVHPGLSDEDMEYLVSSINEVL
ncbi:MAG: DegT/DnrJ/EryC1/StrS family aminotransferase [Methanomicrobiales archaeon]|nr:DegT/DnrJ/EryC1/StrS family aminotransferase [Methanomicrobiales archaeon]